jgi:hypothetical protein
MNTSREQLIEILKDNGVDVIGTSEEFNGSEGGIWINGEGDDYRLNYWAESPSYFFGVHEELNELVEEHGWFFEWYDAGTLMCWK